MRHPTTTVARAADLPIAIIGAGFAGIGMAIRLKQAGMSRTVTTRVSRGA